MVSPPATAVIVAGGQGRRLRPLTATVPKALIEINGEPLVERLIRQVRDAGAERIFMSVGHLSDAIEQRLGDGSRFGCVVSYLREGGDQRLGTAGWLSLLPRSATTDGAPLLVVNGDLVTNVDLAEMLARHRQGGPDATVGVYEHSYEVPYGVIGLDGDRVSALTEKPEVRWLINAGIYIINPAALPFAQRIEPMSMVDVLTRMLAQGAVIRSYRIAGLWRDIGRAEDLILARSQEGL